MEPVIVEIRPPMLEAMAEGAARAAVEAGGDPKEAAEIYIQENTIRLGFVSATRRQAFKRGDAMDAAQKWVIQILGLDDMGDVKAEEIDRDIFLTWMAAWQGADILGALVSHENWNPPDKPEGWAEVPDFIFQPALATAWELNPQWLADRQTEGNV